MTATLISRNVCASCWRSDAFFLQLGSRWAAIPNVTFHRALCATGAAALVGVIPIAILGSRRLIGLGPAILIMVLLSGPSLGLMWLLIGQILRTSFGRAIARLARYADSGGMSCASVALLAARLYVFEAFKTPTNSMAPTILGQHWEAPCPRCGSLAYCTPEGWAVTALK